MTHDPYFDALQRALRSGATIRLDAAAIMVGTHPDTGGLAGIERLLTCAQEGKGKLVLIGADVIGINAIAELACPNVEFDLTITQQRPQSRRV